MSQSFRRPWDSISQIIRTLILTIFLQIENKEFDLYAEFDLYMQKTIRCLPTISAHVQNKGVCLVDENSACSNKDNWFEECVGICFFWIVSEFFYCILATSLTIHTCHLILSNLTLTYRQVHFCKHKEIDWKLVQIIEQTLIYFLLTDGYLLIFGRHSPVMTSLAYSFTSSGWFCFWDNGKKGKINTT